MTKSAKRRDRMFCHCSGLMIFFSLSDNFIKLSLIAVKSHTFVCNPTLHLHLQNTNIDSFIALNKLLPTMIYTIYVSLHRQFNLCGSLYVPLSFMLWKVFFFFHFEPVYNIWTGIWEAQWPPIFIFTLCKT